MRFLEWLFGPKKPPFDTDMKFISVPKWTRAGKNGKEIYCPVCGNKSTVYQFSWSRLMCQKCKTMVNKHDYLLLVEDKK